MADALHPLLLKQLNRVGLTPGDAVLADPRLSALLVHVSADYGDAEQSRSRMEHSQAASSEELGELYTALRASEARLTSLLSLSADWVWEQDAEQRFTYVSTHANSAIDLGSLLLGRRAVHDIHATVPEESDRYQRCVAARQLFRDLTCQLTLPDGRPFYIRISGEPVFDGSTFLGWRGVGSDVTQAVLAEQRILQLARYDSLTGLPNRSEFISELDQALNRAAQSGGGLALFFIDLDHFKNVNDSLGHDAGDELLKTMARRLSGLARGNDRVSRLGGDEFVVVLEGVVETELLARVATRVLAVLCEPMQLAKRRVQLSASVGISVYPADGENAHTLLKNADSAMYLAKSRGKNNYQFFTPQLGERSARRFSVEAELRQAMERSELRLYYQPRFELRGAKLCGIEALLRWVHPQHGLLSPVSFIDVAEESGLIVPIGRWVTYEACRQVRTWRDDGLNVPCCSINVSVRQLDDRLSDDVLTALATHSLPPAAVEVEVTETLLMKDPERVQQLLTRLHDGGVRIAVDDFGTGHSSLAYLKRFPARTLKIDRSFVMGLPGDHDDAAITQAVVAMAHSLGMQVVAEGVETHAQLEFLRNLGCDEVQGYLLARPMSADAMRNMLRSLHKTRPRVTVL